jgi:hypothetical protein
MEILMKAPVNGDPKKRNFLSDWNMLSAQLRSSIPAPLSPVCLCRAVIP